MQIVDLWTLTLQVMECDTLNSIALKFDTTPSEIAHLNKKPPGLAFSLLPGEVCWVWPAALPKGVLMIVSNMGPQYV